MRSAFLVGAASLALVSCTAHFSERPPSLDDPSNPEAPEAAVRVLPSTVSEGSEAPRPQPPPADGMHHGHALYTCPMHPEVVSEQPGQCPKCGMKLVPKAPASEGSP